MNGDQIITKAEPATATTGPVRGGPRPKASDSIGETGAREEDAILFEMVDALPLLDCQRVDAVCIEVRLDEFRPWGQEKLVFSFAVFEPQSYEGTRLPMYVRLVRKWKKPPTSSKLNKLLRVAASDLRAGQGISISKLRQLFQNQAFRCALRVVGEGRESYSVVDRVLERLTGQHL